MNLEQLHNELIKLETAIKSKGLTGEAHAHVNWFGSTYEIQVYAHEAYDKNGYWKTEKSFEGEDINDCFDRASAFVYALPLEEDRATEMLVRKLTELASELPKGGNEIMAEAWKDVHAMLIAKAERIAKNGLPSPTRIQEIKDAS